MPHHVLYRHYDEDDALLYVGVTNNPPARWRAHLGSSPWAREVASTSYESFGSRAELLAAEKAAIIAERPVFNVMHNGGVEDGFLFLGWPETPSEEDWAYVYAEFVESREWAPELLPAVSLFSPFPKLSQAAIAWCTANPRTAWAYGISKSPVLTDTGFLSWLKARGYCNDGVSDLTTDVCRDPGLRRRRWSAQRLWSYFEETGWSESFMHCLEVAAAEYQRELVSVA